ncbi:hypothetical protein V2J09_006031 [Rumex salicifolius]
MGYTYEIQYKQGTENYAADALSRVTGSQLLQIKLEQSHESLYSDIKKAWQEDPSCQKIISDISTKPDSHPKFLLVDGELRRRGKLFIGNDKELKLKILNWLHDSAIGGHSGRDATLHRVKSLFFWPKMNKEKREDVINLLKFHLLRAQNRMKQVANAHRSNRVFSIGEWEPEENGEACSWCGNQSSHQMEGLSSRESYLGILSRLHQQIPLFRSLRTRIISRREY